MRILLPVSLSLVAAVTVATCTRPVAAQSHGTVAPRPLAGAMVRSLVLAFDEGQDDTVAEAWRVRIGKDEATRALLEGTLASLAFRYDEAERLLRRAARDTANPAATYAALSLASLVANRSQFGDALSAMQQQKARLVSAGDVSGLAEVLINEARILLRTEGVPAAKARLREAEALVPGDDAWLRARHACTMLLVRMRATEPVADSTWSRVVGEARQAGPRVHADCLFARAQRVEASGQADRALALFDTLATVQRGARLWSGLSGTLQWRGSTLLARSRYAEARVAIQEALVTARASDSPLGEAWATRDLGRIAQRLGATVDSDSLLLVARRVFMEAGDEIGVLYVSIDYAEGLLLRGELERADSAYAAARVRSERLAPGRRASFLVAQADIARQQRRHEAGHRLLDTASTLAAAHALTGWGAEIRYQRGALFLSSGEFARALAQWDTLEATYDLHNTARFELASRRAEVEAARGNTDEAWKRISAGLREFDRYRATLSRREDVLAALQDRALDWDRDLGLATLASQLAGADRDAEALALSEWRRIRAQEQAALQRGALSVDSRGRVRATAGTNDTAGVDPTRLPALARTRIAPSHAVLSFIVGRGGEPTTAFVLTSDTMISVSLVAVDSIATDIERFTALLAGGRVSDSLAKRLSGALIVPLLPHLPARTTRLVIVPDGALHRLPFAALAHPTGEPLLARYEVVIAPSLGDALGAVSAAARRNSVTRSVVFGAPGRMPLVPGSTERWVALPGARAEARAVANQLAGASLFDGRDATRQQLLRAIGGGGVVLHIATHAVADPGSFSRNGLVLEASPGDDGLFTLDDLSAQPLPFDLVVFSTCSSGDGVLLVGQSPHGLVAAALDAGARGVVATRWPAEDATMGALVARMYAAITAGNDPVTALQQVRLEAMRSGVSPAVWANLEYFGDPSLRLPLTARRPSSWERLTGTVIGWFTR